MNYPLQLKLPEGSRKRLRIESIVRFVLIDPDPPVVRIFICGIPSFSTSIGSARLRYSEPFSPDSRVARTVEDRNDDDLVLAEFVEDSEGEALHDEAVKTAPRMGMHLGICGDCSKGLHARRFERRREVRRSLRIPFDRVDVLLASLCCDPNPSHVAVNERPP